MKFCGSCLLALILISLCTTIASAQPIKKAELTGKWYISLIPDGKGLTIDVDDPMKYYKEHYKQMRDLGLDPPAKDSIEALPKFLEGIAKVKEQSYILFGADGKFNASFPGQGSVTDATYTYNETTGVLLVTEQGKKKADKTVLKMKGKDLQVMADGKVQFSLRKFN